MNRNSKSRKVGLAHLKSDGIKSSTAVAPMPSEPSCLINKAGAV